MNRLIGVRWIHMADIAAGVSIWEERRRGRDTALVYKNTIEAKNYSLKIDLVDSVYLDFIVEEVSMLWQRNRSQHLLLSKFLT